MRFAEKKIDYGLIPVIDVARSLFGPESRERTTANERHFPDRGGLFVNLKKNRWYCHGESTGGDAIELIRFATDCDYKAAFDWLRSHGYESFLGEPPTPKKVLKEYDYTDENGARLYQTVRFEPKDFRQRRSDGNGGWIWKGPERPVPYRLPELLQRTDRAVLIPGGEKDVDNLRALGFTATCNHGGEGKWWPELTPYLKDRRVFILCDNDETGEKHQQVVGEALRGVARELRVVRFPELETKGDVSDFIERRRKEGLDDEAIGKGLRDRCREAPAWQPSASTEQPRVESLDEWPAPDMSVLFHSLISPPKLPLEVFGTYWATWIVEQAEAKSCPPDYIAAALIAGAGALVGNARWGSPWPGWEEPPILWLNVVGYPSSGKSPGLDAIRDLLGAIEADSNIGHQDNLTAWDTQKREAKIRLEVWESDCKAAVKDRMGVMPPKPVGAEKPPRPTRKRIVTNDPRSRAWCWRTRRG
jgi:5S rRNA maturation endonuclease (ribonuclease M5)